MRRLLNVYVSDYDQPVFAELRRRGEQEQRSMAYMVAKAVREFIVNHPASTHTPTPKETDNGKVKRRA
jgi:hypothetical protein